MKNQDYLSIIGMIKNIFKGDLVTFLIMELCCCALINISMEIFLKGIFHVNF